MPRPVRNETLVVIGLGDLGGRVVEALARLPVGRVVAAGRDAERARAVAGQAAIAAAVAHGAGDVVAAQADAGDVAATARLLRELDPAVVVAAASLHTWWRTPPEVAALPYGAWLALQVPLVRDVVRARDEAGVAARVVALPFPDAVGPVLAPSGLAPDVGAGNVGELAAKLEVLAARRAGVARSEVSVRLVAHHATERYAFSAFGNLGGTVEAPAGGPPPIRAEVAVGGERVSAEYAAALFATPYPLLSGRATHAMTAAATAAVAEALVADAPQRVHAPAPAGRPGGYPLLVSRDGIALDLPDETTEDDAVAINAVAARWDGIASIGPDGRVTYTDVVADAAERTLGLRLEGFAPEEADALAAELGARIAAVSGA